MKMKLIYPMLLGALFASQSLHAAIYRVQNTDTDFANLSNWTADEAGTTPISSMPKNGATYVYAPGTTTIVDNSLGNWGWDQLCQGAATVKFSGVNFNLSNRFEGGKVGGTAEQYANSTLIIENGSYLKTWMFYGTKTQYSQLDLIVKDNSTLEVTSTTWNHAQLVNSNDAIANMRIEKGSTLKTASSLAVNGTHGSAQRSVVKMDIYGNVYSGSFFMADSNNSVCDVNIFGSAYCELTGSLNFSKAGANMTLFTQDISLDKISEDFSATGVFVSATKKEGNASAKLNVDLSDFSVDGNLDLGKDYYIALTTLSEETFDKNIVNILNADKMGSAWKLTSENLQDNLMWVDNTLFLTVTSVPEPSTYACILGALALAFVAYRRRK